MLASAAVAVAVMGVESISEATVGSVSPTALADTLLPPSAADMEAWEAAFRKAVVRTVMQPACLDKLREGLQTSDPKERRLWWQMAAEIIKSTEKDAGEGGGPSLKIVFTKNVPDPAHEEGPVRALRDVTPR